MRKPNPISLFRAFILLAGFAAIGINAARLAAGHSVIAKHSLPRGQSSSGTDLPANRTGSHYLLLVNTAVASQMDARKLAQFDGSPYDGLAVSFADAYDTTTIRPVAEMETQVAIWKKSTTKGVWPWVYLNRMIGGASADANADAETSRYIQVAYFQRIQGVDLDNKAGARKDFLENWRNALRVARDTKVPGIVYDPEFYNNYKANDMAELARVTGKPPRELTEELEEFGARMADSAAVEYPGAALWFFFTGFTRPDYRVIDGRPYFFASTYIAKGLLDQIQRRHLQLRVLAGGEVGLGYCHTSVEELRQSIQKRAGVFAPLLKQYNGILEMAGTMTLWSDRSAKRAWLTQGACGGSSAAGVEDLEPYMETLFRAYRYNWIYGSTNGGYFAFQADSAPRFDAAIRRATARAVDGGKP
jgi:hypothetical protein